MSNNLPHDEESIDLYSEFMGAPAEVNKAQSLQKVEYLLEATDPKHTDSVCPEQDGIGEASLDLFTEVLSEELQQKCDARVELSQRCDAAETRVQELEVELKTIKEQEEKNRAQNEIVKKNISSLLLTAKIELKRKDRIISGLKLQLSRKKYVPCKRATQGHDDSQRYETSEENKVNTSPRQLKVSKPVYQKETSTSIIKRKRSNSEHNETTKRRKLSSLAHSDEPEKQNGFCTEGSIERTPNSKRKNQKEMSQVCSSKSTRCDLYESNKKEKENKHKEGETNIDGQIKWVSDNLIDSKSRQNEGKDIKDKEKNGDIRERKHSGSKDRTLKANYRDRKGRDKDDVIREKACNIKGKGDKERDPLNRRKDLGSRGKDERSTNEATNYRAKKRHQSNKERDHGSKERDQGRKERDQGRKERDCGSKERDHGSKERDCGSKERDQGRKERDQGRKERDCGRKERDHGSKERDCGSKERDRGSKERDHGRKERDHGSKERDHGSKERDHRSKERDKYKESGGHENRESGESSSKSGAKEMDVHCDTVKESSRHSSGQNIKNVGSKNTNVADLRDILKKKRAGVKRVEDKKISERSVKGAGDSKRDHSQEVTNSDSGKSNEVLLDEISKPVALDQTSTDGTCDTVSVDDKLVIDLHPQSDTCPENESPKKQTVDQHEFGCQLPASEEHISGTLESSDNPASSLADKCQAGAGSTTDSLVEGNEINAKYAETGDTVVLSCEQTSVSNSVETEEDKRLSATHDSAIGAKADASAISEEKRKIKHVMVCDKSLLNPKVQEQYGGATNDRVVTTTTGESAKTQESTSESEESSVSSSLPEGNENGKEKSKIKPILYEESTKIEEKRRIRPIMLCDKSFLDLKVQEQNGRVTHDSAVAAMTVESPKMNESANKKESVPETGESDTSASLPDSLCSENRKEKRRIKPVMLCDRSGLNPQFQEHSDEGSCFDSVISNIEIREKFSFANAKVVHVDRTHSDIQCSEEIEEVLPKVVAEISSECSFVKKSEAVEIDIEVKAGNGCDRSKEHKTRNVGFCVSPEMKDESLSQGGDVHMSVSKESAVYCREENEHLLVCAPYPHSDKSSFSLCSELTAESVSSFASERNCSPEMLMAEETCSRTSPYSPSHSVEKGSALGASAVQHHSSSHKSECNATGEEAENHDNSRSNLSYKSVVLHNAASGSERGLNLFPEPDKSEAVSELDTSSSLHSQKNETTKLDQKCLPQDNEYNLNGPPCKLKKLDAEEKIIKKDTPSTEKEKASAGVVCVDSRLQSHPKTSYHVEPFEFSSFPESYAKSVLSEENTPEVENNNDSFEEQMVVDGSPKSGDCKQNVLSCNSENMSDKSQMNCVHEVETELTSPDKDQDKSNSPKSDDFRQNVSSYNSENMSDKSLSNCVHEVETELTSPEKEQDKGNSPKSDDFRQNVSSYNSENMSEKSLTNCVHEVETDLSSPDKEEDNGTQVKQSRNVSPCLDNIHESKTKIQRQISMPNSETPSCVAFSVTPRTRSKSESADSHNVARIPDQNPRISLGDTAECQPIDLSVKPQPSASPAVSRQSSHYSKHSYVSGFCVSKHGALDLSQKSRKGDQYQDPITDTPHVSPLSIHSPSNILHNGSLVDNTVVNSASVCMKNGECNGSLSVVKTGPAAEPDTDSSFTEKDSAVDSTPLRKKGSDQHHELPTSSDTSVNTVSTPKDESTEEIISCSKRNSSEEHESIQSEQCTEDGEDGDLCKESKLIVIKSVTPSVKSSDKKMSNAEENNAACLNLSKSSSSCQSVLSSVPSQESSCSITTNTKPSSSETSMTLTDSPPSQNTDKASDTSDGESLIDVCVAENENFNGFEKDCLTLSKAISDDVLRSTLAADLDLSDDDSCSSKAFSVDNSEDKKGLESSEPSTVFKLPLSIESDACPSVAHYKIDNIVSPDATSTGFVVDHDESSVLSIIEDNSDFELEQGMHGDYFKSPKKRDHSRAEKCSKEPGINDDSIEEGEVCGLEGSPEDSVDLQELLKERELLEKKIRNMRSSVESSSSSYRHDPRGKFEKRRLEREGRYSHDQKNSPRERKSSSECYRYSREIHGSDPRLSRSSRSSRDSESRHRYSSPSRDGKRERLRDRSPHVHRNVYREPERRPSGDRRESRHHDRSHSLRDGDRVKSRSSLHYHSSRRDSRS